jgi:translation initiation factor 1
MDLQDQLKALFPDHTPEPKSDDSPASNNEFSTQDDPIVCKYEKRKGKPVTLIENFYGNDQEYKKLAKHLKTKLSVGGSFKNGQILIQGDYRNEIMNELKTLGFSVKRVGG